MRYYIFQGLRYLFRESSFIPGSEKKKTGMKGILSLVI